MKAIFAPRLPSKFRSLDFLLRSRPHHVLPGNVTRQRRFRIVVLAAWRKEPAVLRHPRTRKFCARFLRARTAASSRCTELCLTQNLNGDKRVDHGANVFLYARADGIDCLVKHCLGLRHGASRVLGKKSRPQTVRIASFSAVLHTKYSQTVTQTTRQSSTARLYRHWVVVSHCPRACAGWPRRGEW